jgi:hypothetical protein
VLPPAAGNALGSRVRTFCPWLASLLISASVFFSSICSFWISRSISRCDFFSPRSTCRICSAKRSSQQGAREAVCLCQPARASEPAEAGRARRAAHSSDRHRRACRTERPSGSDTGLGGRAGRPSLGRRRLLRQSTQSDVGEHTPVRHTRIGSIAPSLAKRGYPLPRKGCLAKECCLAALLRRGSCCLRRVAPGRSGLFARRSGPRREVSSKVTADPDRPRARAPAPPTSCTTSCSRTTRRSCPCATSAAVAAPRDQTLRAAWQTPSVAASDGAEGAARPPRPPPQTLAAVFAHGLIKRVWQGRRGRGIGEAREEEAHVV